MSYLLVDATNVIMRFASAMTTLPFDELGASVKVQVCRAAARALAECADVVDATHLIAAFDSGIASWRRDRYPEYKALRTTTTAVWSNVFTMYLTKRHVLCLREPSFEADDVLATLAARLERVGKVSYILSGDSDLLQCTSLLTKVVQFGSKGDARFMIRSMEWIREKYDLPSAGHLAAYKALVGEPGDGLPGVHGVGPVKARRLLATATALADIPLLLREGQSAEYQLALDLVTLRTDVPLFPIHPTECRLRRSVLPRA